MHTVFQGMQPYGYTAGVRLGPYLTAVVAYICSDSQVDIQIVSCILHSYYCAAQATRVV